MAINIPVFHPQFQIKVSDYQYTRYLIAISQLQQLCCMDKQTMPIQSLRKTLFQWDFLDTSNASCSPLACFYFLVTDEYRKRQNAWRLNANLL